MPHFRATLGVVLLGLIGFVPGRAVAAEPAAVAIPAIASPSLQQGTLPNGFRYAILPHAREMNQIGLRLLVHAGSLDERDDEHGYAHFVEHMAFNGTKHYPAGKLVRFFQKLGLSFGADLAATTGFTETIYRIDLPSGKADHLPEALEVLRDFADGIRFSPKEVDREKGVILSELLARDTPIVRQSLDRIAAVYAGTGLPERLPIGNTTAIQQATRESLRRFYERCYRPNRMTLVVVGDIDPTLIEQRIGHHFGTLAARDKETAIVSPRSLPLAPLHAQVIVSSIQPFAEVSLVAAFREIEPLAKAIETDLSESMVAYVLGRRLAERKAKQEGIGAAFAGRTASPTPFFCEFSFGAQASPKNWELAVGLLESELRRLRTHGITLEEISEAISAGMISLRTRRDEFPGRRPETVAQEIVNTLAAHKPWTTPDDYFLQAEAYLRQFTAADAHRTIERFLNEETLCLILTTPLAIEGGGHALAAAYRESAKQPLPATNSDPVTSLKFAYTDFGAPGSKIEHHHEKDLGTEHVFFANGIRLNLRPSQSEPGQFRLRALVGRGFSDIPKDKPGLPLLASLLLSKSGWGKHTLPEVSRLVRLHGIKASWETSEAQMIITATGPSDKLPFMLQFLTACLSDTRPDTRNLHEAKSHYLSWLHQSFSSTETAAKIETMFAMTNQDPRANVTPADKLTFDLEEVTTWIRAHWTKGPIEIGIAGEIDSDSVIAAAAASMGTLPVREATTAQPSDARTLRSTRYRNIIHLSVPDQPAIVRITWPTPAAANVRHYRCLQVASTALRDRLQRRLREELGVTYSPQAGIHRDPLQPDFSFAWLELMFDPKQAKEMGERTLKMANEFARRSLSKEEFIRLREPFRAEAAANLRSNSWWAENVLAYAQRRPITLDETRRLIADFDDITRDEVNRVIKTFATTRATAILMLPQAAEKSPPQSAAAP